MIKVDCLSRALDSINHPDSCIVSFDVESKEDNTPVRFLVRYTKTIQEGKKELWELTVKDDSFQTEKVRNL